MTGLAIIIRPHRSSLLSPETRVQQCTPKVSGALTSDLSRSKERIRALAIWAR